MNTVPESSANEAATVDAVSSGPGTMQKAGPFQLTKESTIEAFKDVFGGLWSTITGRNGGRARGAGRMFQGVANAVEAPFSLGADVLRAPFMESTGIGQSESSFNITRSGEVMRNAKTIRGQIGGAILGLHALAFRSGVDGVRWATGAHKPQLQGV